MQPEKPQGNKPLQSLWTRVWRSIRYRPLQKLAALVLAVLFWGIVVAGDPTLIIERTIVNAPVTISGQGTLPSGKGLIVTDDLSSGTITTTMRIQVKRSDYDRATLSNFTPRLDLSSQISQAGEDQQVFFSVPNNGIGEVLSFEPDSITVNVERYASKSRIPIVWQFAGKNESPIWVTNITTDPQMLSITGPQSLVDSVKRAVVELPLEGLDVSRPSDRISVPFELQDADGEPVVSSLLRVNTSDGINVDSVVIELNTYPTREIPVHAEGLTTGQPAHGYTVADVRVSPDNITVAAEQDVLDALDVLYPQLMLNISGMTESTVSTVALRKNTGILHMSAEEVTVEVDIVPAMHVHTYVDLPVIVMGLDSQLNARLSHDTMDVIIRGDYDQVQALEAEDITLYVDAAGLHEGVHMLDVQCLVNGTTEYTCEPELPRVTVTLTANVDGTNG